MVISVTTNNTGSANRSRAAPRTMSIAQSTTLFAGRLRNRHAVAVALPRASPQPAVRGGNLL